MPLGVAGVSKVPQAEGLALATLPEERAAFRPLIQISRKKPNDTSHKALKGVI
jgi:hypothetical protein